jgi:hypothetical protein
MGIGACIGRDQINRKWHNEHFEDRV